MGSPQSPEIPEKRSWTELGVSLAIKSGRLARFEWVETPVIEGEWITEIPPKIPQKGDRG